MKGGGNSSHSKAVGFLAQHFMKINEKLKKKQNKPPIVPVAFAEHFFKNKGPSFVKPSNNQEEVIEAPNIIEAPIGILTALCEKLEGARLDQLTDEEGVLVKRKRPNKTKKMCENGRYKSIWNDMEPDPEEPPSWKDMPQSVPEEPLLQDLNYKYYSFESSYPSIQKTENHPTLTPNPTTHPDDEQEIIEEQAAPPLTWIP